VDFTGLATKRAKTLPFQPIYLRNGFDIKNSRWYVYPEIGGDIASPAAPAPTRRTPSRTPFADRFSPAGLKFLLNRALVA